MCFRMVQQCSDVQWLVVQRLKLSTGFVISWLHLLELSSICKNCNDVVDDDDIDNERVEDRDGGDGDDNDNDDDIDNGDV